MESLDTLQLLEAVTRRSSAQPPSRPQQQQQQQQTEDAVAPSSPAAAAAEDDDDLWLASVRELAARSLASADAAQLLAEHEVATHLLALELRATKKKMVTKLRVARWEALAAFAQSDSQLLRQQIVDSALVLRVATRERFESRDVLAAMAQCVVALATGSGRAGSLLDGERESGGDSREDSGGDDADVTYLELIKQMYVTLSDAALRQALVDALQQLIASKEHAKAAVRKGVLRAVLQVAIDDSNAALRAQEQQSPSDDASDDGAGSSREDLMGNSADLLAHVASFVCFKSASLAAGASPDSASAADPSTELRVCERVVALMLSGVSLAFQEGVRLLQMVVENPRLRALVVHVVDLRGALEKAHTLAQQHEAATRALDPYVATLSRQQYELLRPEIDAVERSQGASLVGLPPDPSADASRDTSAGSLEAALELAQQCKERGNWFFKRGNSPAARAFYRRAISLLRMAQRQREQQLATLSAADVLRQCSTGASVQVQSRGAWRNAMVADVEDGQVEVIYDDDDSEDAVGVSRVRLRLHTSVLDAFEALEVDCAMNMGKAFSQLHEHERAAECFSHALAVKRELHAAALYHRGVAHLALHDLKSAQQDLWRANELARKSGDKALGKVVGAAYKRLQGLHATKKKADKRAVKEMMKYLATVMPAGDSM